MLEAVSLFQRTENGRNEIYYKSHGLTQSERRVLITIDGVTPYADLIKKMSSLTEARIQRAVSTLLERGLVFEVLMPLDEQQPDHIDGEVIDKFLQQDPLDPATIISLDPEEDFGEIEEILQQALPEIKAAIANRRPVTRPGVTEATMPDFIELAYKDFPDIDPPVDAKLVEGMQNPAEREVPPSAQVEKPKQDQSAKQLPKQQPTQRSTPPTKVATVQAAASLPQGRLKEAPHWGVWLVGAGVGLMVISALARLLGG